MRLTIDLTDGQVAALEKVKDDYNWRRRKSLTLLEWVTMLVHEQAVAEKLQERTRHVKDDVANRHLKAAQEEIDETLEAERNRLIAEL